MYQTETKDVKLVLNVLNLSFQKKRNYRLDGNGGHEKRKNIFYVTFGILTAFIVCSLGH